MGFRFYALGLVGVCVVVYLLQLMYPVITDSFVLVSSEVFAKPWTLVTSMFLHSPTDPSHLFYNMFALGLFGSILERVIGGRKFLIIFFVTGVIAGIGSLFFYTAVLGASGAIMGILGCLAILRPRMIVWALGVPMPMIVAAGFWALLDLVGFFSQGGSIANAAHLAGLFSGVAIGFFWRTGAKEPRREDAVDEKDIDQWEDQYMGRE